MRLPGIVAFVFASIAVGAPTPGDAHPGGLDANGCHTNHKTGEYHCHRSGAARNGSTVSRTLGARSTGGPFRNCTEARAAGAAPVRRGDPGYGPHLDRDNDGIGCE
jgi:hypothetical protein